MQIFQIFSKNILSHVFQIWYYFLLPWENKQGLAWHLNFLAASAEQEDAVTATINTVVQDFAEKV